MSLLTGSSSCCSRICLCMNHSPQVGSHKLTTQKAISSSQRNMLLPLKQKHAGNKLCRKRPGSGNLQQRKVRKIGGWKSLRRQQELKHEERAANKRYNDYWEKVKREGWGDKLHELIKANMRNPPLNLKTPQNLAVPSVCRYNQKLRCCKLDSKEKGKTPVW
jgi:hypothetical protein